MCHSYCKRPASEQVPLPGMRVKVSTDCEASSSARLDGIAPNERLLPCTDFESFMANVEPTLLTIGLKFHYNSKNF